MNNITKYISMPQLIRGGLSVLLGMFLLAGGGLMAQTSNTPSNDFGTMTFTPDGRGIRISFAPTNRINCDRIVLTQTVQIVFSNGDDVTPQPGDVTSIWDYRNKNALSNGTFVDHASTSEDPEINGNDRDQRTGAEAGSQEDLGTAGSRNAAGTSPSTTHDYPFFPDGVFPEGKTRVTLKLEICASCAEGNDVGTVYGCATFEYTRTKGAAGQGSTASTEDSSLDPPSSDFMEAVDLFEENHINEDGDRYCPD